jgi:ketosteroid isomerase-like protein
MNEHATDNRRIVEQAYAGLARGDLDAFLTPLAADVEWSEAAGLALTGGEYRGRDTVAERVLGPFTSQVADLAVTPETFVAERERVVVLGRYTGTAVLTGQPIDLPFAHIWQLQDGTASRFTQLTDTARFNQAFGTPLPALAA